MKQEVAAYYDQTQNHYQRWWHLDKGMSLHYGLWDKNTSSFLTALENTNTYMAHQALVQEGEAVLDAGCGVGGAAIYLARNYSTRVTGITLSSLQVETARQNAKKHNVNHGTKFIEGDFTKTSFEDQSFDVIWACESSSSAVDKGQMLREWFRLLKPGGRIILLDFFKTEKSIDQTGKWLNKWCNLWAMSPLVTVKDFEQDLGANGFDLVQKENLTTRIAPTINRMYWSYLLGFIPANLYNLFFGARIYSRNHYKSGYYQYQAYKLGLWEYHSFLVKKPD